MTNGKQVGRLALRSEGTMWNAYWAVPDTMDGALLLGSIRLVMVENEEHKHAFLILMQAAVTEMLHVHGIDPQAWETISAPEHERGGNA